VFAGSSTEADINAVKEEFRKLWDLEGVDDRELLLGITMKKMDDGDIWLTQGPYFEKVLRHFNLWDIHPVGTLLVPNSKLCAQTEPLEQSEATYMSNKPFRSLLGGILWGSSGTRPNLAFAAGILARMQNMPGPEHWNALVGVCHYIKGLLDYGLLLHKPKESEINTPGLGLIGISLGT
jgi:hypothetical protein